MPSQTRSLPPFSSIVLSLFAWVLTAIVTLLYSSAGIFIVFPLTVLFDRGLTCMHLVSRGWGKALLGLSPIWSLKVTGREHIVRGQNYVIVANHQSLLDILVLLAGVPVQFKFMAKKELFAIPFLGWHMALSGYIPIDRSGSVEARKRALGQAKERLEQKISVLFFPEGTRSTDGKIHDFKGGAFHAAVDQKVPVLPVVINGTLDAIPKKSWRIRKPTCFHVAIQPPVKLTEENIKQKQSEIRETMIRALDRLRSE